MKQFLVLIAALFAFTSTSALASGKLTLKPAWEQESNDHKYTLGLSIYERVADLAYKGWIGAGTINDEADDTWYKVDNGAEWYWGPIALGGGISYEWTPGRDTETTELYGSISATLW